MKKTITTIISVLLVIAVVNDLARYAKASYDLNNIAEEAADQLSTNRSKSRDSNARDAVEYATARGATVYLFDQTNETIHVWVQMPLTGTWILGPAMALVAGESISTPYQLQADAQARFR